ncbi:MAG: NfeD family protein [Oscillospiraceae bacterium]|nr:NfeD family protein [Oscillospiraceae bacterium]
MNFASLTPAVFWLVAMLALLAVEAAVPGLVSIWFAIGALAALISALFHAPFWLQLVWFLLVSVLTLVLTRPLVRKYINSRTVATNADMALQKDAVVTEKIDNLQATGAVRLGGKTWSARMADETKQAETGETVHVLRIEGVKLIVEKKSKEEGV